MSFPQRQNLEKVTGFQIKTVYNITCVIGWFFIILFSFSLSFICTSFMFVVGSCNFDAPENLMC